MMRIIFRESGSHLVRVVLVVSFYGEFHKDGYFVVNIEDADGDFWSCKSMSFDDYDEYAYHLAVNGFIDLRRYLFSYEG